MSFAATGPITTNSQDSQPKPSAKVTAATGKTAKGTRKSAEKGQGVMPKEGKQSGRKAFRTRNESKAFLVSTIDIRV